MSIKKVAQIAGVSIATVSRCLNEPEKVKVHTRKKVQTAIKQTGYSPNSLAQSFRRGRTQQIMVVLPSVGDPFFTDVMAGIHTIAKQNGYSILIKETQFNTMTADEIGSMTVSKQVDGLILLATLSPFGADILSARNNRALPMVIGGEAISPELTALPNVHIDNIAASMEATNYLINHGHRVIGFISGAETSLLTKDRELGFKKAMVEAGLVVGENWIQNGNLTIDGAKTACRTLLSEVKPTALFCANDEMAMGAIHEIKSWGLSVPSDISVIGFDNTRYAAIIDPPLTTIDQPAKDIGEQSVQLLLEMIDFKDKTTPPSKIVPHKLVVRESVHAIT